MTMIGNSKGTVESARLMWKRYDEFPTPIKTALMYSAYEWHTAYFKKFFRQCLVNYGYEAAIEMTVYHIEHQDRLTAAEYGRPL